MQTPCQSYTACCRVCSTHLEENFAQANSPRDQRLAAPAAMSEMDDLPSGRSSYLTIYDLSLPFKDPVPPRWLLHFSRRKRFEQSSPCVPPLQPDNRQHNYLSEAYVLRHWPMVPNPQEHAWMEKCPTIGYRIGSDSPDFLQQQGPLAQKLYINIYFADLPLLPVKNEHGKYPSYSEFLCQNGIYIVSRIRLAGLKGLHPLHQLCIQLFSAHGTDCRRS